MYRVIVEFVDLKDENHRYKVGDIFPREGKAAAKARLVELSSTANKRGKALIELVEEKPVEAVEEEPKKPTRKTTSKRAAKKKE